MKDANFIVETFSILAARDGENSWPVLAKDAKRILDARFGTEWNILIGKAVGYAMKTKKKSSIIISNPNGEMIVCWKSPGFEVEDADAVRVKAKIQVDGKDTLLEDKLDASKLNIVQYPAADSEAYTVETNKALSILQAFADDIKDMDDQTAARYIRTQYVFPPLSYPFQSIG